MLCAFNEYQYFNIELIFKFNAMVSGFSEGKNFILVILAGALTALGSVFAAKVFSVIITLLCFIFASLIIFSLLWPVFLCLYSCLQIKISAAWSKMSMTRDLSNNVWSVFHKIQDRLGDAANANNDQGNNTNGYQGNNKDQLNFRDHNEVILKSFALLFDESDNVECKTPTEKLFSQNFRRSFDDEIEKAIKICRDNFDTSVLKMSLEFQMYSSSHMRGDIIELEGSQNIIGSKKEETLIATLVPTYNLSEIQEELKLKSIDQDFAKNLIKLLNERNRIIELAVQQKISLMQATRERKTSTAVKYYRKRDVNFEKLDLSEKEVFPSLHKIKFQNPINLNKMQEDFLKKSNKKFTSQSKFLRKNFKKLLKTVINNCPKNEYGVVNIYDHRQFESLTGEMQFSGPMSNSGWKKKGAGSPPSASNANDIVQKDKLHSNESEKDEQGILHDKDSINGAQASSSSTSVANVTRAISSSDTGKAENLDCKSFAELLPLIDWQKQDQEIAKSFDRIIFQLLRENDKRKFASYLKNSFLSKKTESDKSPLSKTKEITKGDDYIKMFCDFTMFCDVDSKIATFARNYKEAHKEATTLIIADNDFGSKPALSSIAGIVPSSKHLLLYITLITSCFV